jgi:hypothetical protein
VAALLTGACQLAATTEPVSAATVVELKLNHAGALQVAVIGCFSMYIRHGSVPVAAYQSSHPDLMLLKLYLAR